MLIRFERVSLELHDGRGGTTRVLHDIDFGIERGERFVILGPSGAGKSSLLRLINRLQDPTSGRILLDGEPNTSIDVVALRRRCAFVFQQPVPLPGTVEDNLLTGPRLRRADIDSALERIAPLLEKVRLDPELRSRNAEDLSVGQQHRMALARALMNDPDVLLLDEPTAALDPGTSTAILDLICELNADLSLTIIMVTHDFREARRLAGSAAVIIDGRMRAVGGADVLRSSDDPEVRRFLSGG